MKRMCVAPLCIAVLVARHAASAQENGSVKSDELARTSLDCNRQNSTPCQPVAQAQRVGNQAEVQPGSAGGNGLPPLMIWNHKRGRSRSGRFTGSTRFAGCLATARKGGGRNPRIGGRTCPESQRGRMESQPHRGGGSDANRELAGTGVRCYANLQSSLDRVGYGPFVQKTLDPLQESRIHVRRRARVDSHQGERHHHQFSGRRNRAGLYVLAVAKAQVRLVYRAGIRLHVWARPRSGDRRQHRPADFDPLTPVGGHDF